MWIDRGTSLGLSVRGSPVQRFCGKVGVLQSSTLSAQCGCLCYLFSIKLTLTKSTWPKKKSTEQCQIGEITNDARREENGS